MEAKFRLNDLVVTTRDVTERQVYKINHPTDRILIPTDATGRVLQTSPGKPLIRFESGIRLFVPVDALKYEGDVDPATLPPRVVVIYDDDTKNGGHVAQVYVNNCPVFFSDVPRRTVVSALQFTVSALGADFITYETQDWYENGFSPGKQLDESKLEEFRTE